VTAAYAGLGISLDNGEAACLLARVRVFATRMKRAPDACELRAFHDELNSTRARCDSLIQDLIVPQATLAGGRLS